jgi:methyl-accepting chemotaxis protein
LLDEQRATYLAALEKMTPAFKGDANFDKVRGGLLKMAEELKRVRKMRESGDLEALSAFLTNECSPLRRQIVADIAVVLTAAQDRSARRQRWRGRMRMMRSCGSCCRRCCRWWSVC